ncbi:PilZ domain-containing protein [Croceibacterium aestuarii]|uniref:PilZ domain-containing protein n=1 Tax=Croceibacterium aestuarii TaxID=3064139 RepID=UPI00272DE6DE|nr:PilZ domain-containing protein [Croceibacterium sp. D39]
MTVLVIRTHKRFAVRRSVTLRGGPPKRRGGLMIELSTEGCRISNADSLAYTIDQEVVVELDDGETLPGFVRWAHDGFVGVRFARALRRDELASLLEVSRPPEYRAAVA